MLDQQGDVLFHSVDKLPDDLKVARSKDNKFILAEGEATGHHHSIEASSDCLIMEDKDGTLWCIADKDTTVKHQEHDPITLPKGIYKVGIVRTVDPLTDEIGAVRD